MCIQLNKQISIIVKPFNFGFILALLMASASAMGQPWRCSGGYQDSSCRGVLMNAAQASPSCSTQPGWITAAPAKWIGSKFTAPSCTYTAPPACTGGAGWSATTPPVWSGSTWTTPACSYTPPPSCPAGYEVIQSAVWINGQWQGLLCQPLQTPQRPEQQFNGKTFTLMMPVSNNQWIPGLKVTGSADSFKLTHLDLGTSCTINGPGSSCSWGATLSKPAHAISRVEELISNPDGYLRYCDDYPISQGEYSYSVEMAGDGSLVFYAYHTPGQMDCLRTGSRYFTEGIKGQIPVSFFPNINNGSNIYWDINFSKRF